MELIWYGNATVKIRAQGTSVITDPYITRNVELPPLTISDLSDIQGMLITHGHFDHVIDVPRFVSKKPTSVYAPQPVVENLSGPLGIEAALLPDVELRKPIDIEKLRITAYHAEHIDFDLPIIVQTLNHAIRQLWLSRKQRKLFVEGLRDHRKCPLGDCVGWYIEAEGKSVLHFGSLAIDSKENYPTDIDVLSIPFQGNSRIEQKALEIVKALNPKTVFVHHFDDAFPPISQYVPTEPFVEMMAEIHPDIPVTIPEYRKVYEI